MACNKCKKTHVTQIPPINEKGDAPESMKGRRMEICLSCPVLRHWTKLPGTEQCGICNCFIRAKTALKREKCPAGLWAAEA